MLGLRIFVYGVIVLMLLPVLITFPVALTAMSRISFPPIGLSLRWFDSILTDQVLLQSIARGFWLALTVAVLSIAIAASLRLRRPARAGPVPQRS